MKITEPLTEEEKRERRDNLIIKCLISEADIIMQSRERMLLDYLSDIVNMRLSRMKAIFSSIITSNPIVDCFNIPDKKNLISLYEFVESFYNCYQAFKEEFDKLPKIEPIILWGLISRFMTEPNVVISENRNPDIDAYIALFQKYQPLFETYASLCKNPTVCQKKNCTLKIEFVGHHGNIYGGLEEIMIVLSDDEDSDDSCKLVAHIDLRDDINIIREDSNIINGKTALKPVTEEILKERLFNKIRLGNYTLDTFELSSGFTKALRENVS